MTTKQLDADAITALALALARTPYPWMPSHEPVSDWKHDDDRVAKAAEKRQRKAAKRLKDTTHN